MKREKGISGLGDISDIDLNIQEVIIGRWISSTTGTPVANTTTYLTELEKLGQATQTLPAEDSVYNYGTGVPYKSVLMPTRNVIKHISRSNIVRLRTLSFYALDTTKSGSAYQTSSVFTAITTSESTDDAYRRTPYLNSEIAVDWQPNFFNPQFRINDKNILPAAISGYNGLNFDGVSQDDGVLATGLTLPVTFSDIYFKSQNPINKIEVVAFCVQPIDVGGTIYYQRYPVVCEAEFVI